MHPQLICLMETQHRKGNGVKCQRRQIGKVTTSCWQAGDQQGAASAVAAAVGIDAKHVHAGIKPDGKAALVKQLQSAGRCVAMVGDGANDAAALAQVGVLAGELAAGVRHAQRCANTGVITLLQADVGIAMGSGVDAAAEVANIVLLGDRVPQASHRVA